MLRIGLTGGMAAGKSLVAAQFQRFGTPVVDADVLAREVVAPGTQGLESVVTALGDWVLTSAGELDRAALRAHVVSDDDARQRLEAIVHPRVRQRMRQELDALARAGHAYALSVIPLLVETGQAGAYDRVVVVDTPEALQLARLQRRDSAAAHVARRWLANQASRWQRLQCANDVITNADALPESTTLTPQVRALDRKYRLLAAASR